MYPIRIKVFTEASKGQAVTASQCEDSSPSDIDVVNFRVESRVPCAWIGFSMLIGIFLHNVIWIQADMSKIQ